MIRTPSYAIICLCFGFMLTGLRTAGQEIRTLNWAPKSGGELPEFVDNSLSEHFPPVFSQLGGSCAQAANIGYMFTYEINSLLNRDASLAENRFSYLYSWNFINGGKDEGSIGTEGLNIALANGVITEADFPKQYTGTQFKWADGYEKYFEGMHYRVLNFLNMDASSEEGIRNVKQYLWNKGTEGSKGGVVTFSSKAGEWKFDNNYSGPSGTGYKSLLTQLSPTGPHAMTIAGYDDLVEFTAPDGTVHKGAFIVVNSYGEYFHDRGRFYLPYWFFLQERDPGDLSYEVTGANVEYRNPDIVFKVGLDYSSRDDISFRFGVSGKSSDTRPLHDYVVPIANNQGGDYPMQGKSGEGTMEFGFDFSSYSERVGEMADPNYFLTVVRSRRGEIYGEGKMLSFAVYDYRNDYENPSVYVHTDIAGKEILPGENIFNIPTSVPDRCSYSPVEWLNTQGQPYAAPFVIRTAKGKYAKVRFSDYDRENGTVRIKYVYAPDGSRNIK